LNFGNPYNPEVYWQFVGAIQGMGRACRHFNTPVTGGNVSFYNQTAKPDGSAQAVFPTPTIGMVGVMENRAHHTGLDFKEKGELIFLLGGSSGCINASEYLANIVGIDRSPAPHFDLEEEGKLHACLREVAQKGLAAASHDVADGGLFITLLEMAMPNGLGFDIVTDDEVRLDGFLFGEGQGRAVVSIREEDQDDFYDVCDAHGKQPMLLGHVTKGKLVVDEKYFGFSEELRAYYDNALEELLTED
jgi:phosphoribosylformylglycinamidine synthase